MKHSRNPVGDRQLSFLRIFCQLLCLLVAIPSFSSCSSKGNSFQIEAQASQRTLNWLKNEYGLISEPRVQAFLNRLLFRLAAGTSTASLAVRIPQNESPVLTRWRVFVLKSSEPNAFAIGGGSIVISSSLFMLCRTESELASIISHEMSHQMLGHIKEALSEAQNNNHEEEGPARRRPTFSYSLEHEIEADRLGLLLLNLARYDVKDALSALSIGYRTSSDLVSDDWLETRTSRLKAIVGKQDYSPYSTRTTREFNRSKRLLSQLQ